MTPLEANEEARVALANAKWNGEKARIEADVLECLLATAEREAKQSTGHSVYCQLIGNGMPEGMGHEDQAKWLWTRFSGYRQGIADLTEREAKLREAVTGFVAAWDHGNRGGSELPWIEKMRAALEPKGGE